ncbi:MAG: sulfatase [Candidatus Sumerlaeota bacterium]
MVKKPNLLFITWHDTGRHFGCYGVETVQSPNVDRLAAEGVLFENCFATATMCSPSRGSAMTGQYPQTNGLIHLCHGNYGWAFNKNVKHLGELLTERGYQTALHGFQHEVAHNNVERLGHQEHVNTKPAPPIYPVPPCEVIADGAAEWLKDVDTSEKPFFMQLGFFETHRQYDFGGAEPDEEKGVAIPAYLQEGPEIREDMAELQGSIKKADANVGKVLEALESANLADDTIVVFTVDHGLHLPGAKATMYDGGMEIILVMRWPAGGVSGGKRLERLVSNIDLVPTLFEMMGLDDPGVFEGASFASALGDDYAQQPERDAVYCMLQQGEQRAVRTKKYKWIRNFDKLREYARPIDFSRIGKGFFKPDGHVNIAPAELYDLENDPQELNNMADDPAMADIRRQMDERLWNWMESVEDPLLHGLTPTPRWRENIKDYTAR